MHAVIMEVQISDASAADTQLKEQIVPMVSGLEGFVAAHWVRLSATTATSMIVFDSEASAERLAAQARSMPGGAMTGQRIEVGEVIAHA